MIGALLSGRYEVLREVGRGGMGVVYVARDPLLDREVAVKVLHAGGAASHETLERFRREARVVAKLDHPAVVAVYDIGEHDGSLFFVMPWVAGSNLRQVLAGDSLSLPELVEVLIQVADALEASHARGVVHRDIKPENILVR